MEKQNLTTGFQNVDNSHHQFLIKFLEDVGVFPPVLEGFEIQVNSLGIKEGDHVLDVGCGIGVQASPGVQKVTQARWQGREGNLFASFTGFIVSGKKDWNQCY